MNHLLGIVALFLSTAALIVLITIATACACYWIDGGERNHD